MTTPSTIPIPWRQRWHDVRTRYLPALVLAAIVLTLVWLWKDYAAAPLLVGQAEAIPANVSCYKAGTLAKLCVSRFQKVKAGDVIGEVLVTDPKILAASLDMIQAEIKSLEASQQPTANAQRLAMEYSEVDLHWMAQRAQLGAAKADLLAAQADFNRTEELFKDKIVSQRALDLAKAKQDSLLDKVSELTVSVKEQETKMHLLLPTNTYNISRVTEDPMQAAIAAEDAKLKLTEADLGPITLRASVDGMVDVVSHQAGDSITAGEAIVTIAPFNSVRIIGYLRPPLLQEPKVGGEVEVRTRGPNQQSGTAKIVEVGTQFEALPVALQIPVKLPNSELGLPLAISVPAGLKIRPGELVDLRLVATAAAH